MKATKGNKVYDISEQEMKRYQAEGYDIEKDGNIIAYGKGKAVPYDDYVKLKAENDQLKDELAKLKAGGPVKDSTTGTDPLANMSVEELLAYAQEKQIDIGRATSRDGILEKIRAAEKSGG